MSNLLIMNIAPPIAQVQPGKDGKLMTGEMPAEGDVFAKLFAGSLAAQQNLSGDAQLDSGAETVETPDIELRPDVEEAVDVEEVLDLSDVQLQAAPNEVTELETVDAVDAVDVAVEEAPAAAPEPDIAALALLPVEAAPEPVTPPSFRAVIAPPITDAPEAIAKTEPADAAPVMSRPTAPDGEIIADLQLDAALQDVKPAADLLAKPAAPSPATSPATIGAAPLTTATPLEFSAPAPQVAAPVTTLPALTTAAWPDEAAAVIALAGVAAGKEAKFQLSPPELGQLSVELKRDDGDLRVEIVTGSDAARSELERHMPRLIERLREELANNEQRARDQFEDMAQAFADADARSPQGRAAARGETATGDDAAETASNRNSRSGGDGRISLFA